MALLTLKNGNKKTGPDTNVNWATNIVNAQVDSEGILECLIQISIATTGIKFCVANIGESAMDADAYALPVNGKIVIKFKPGIQQLMWQMSAATDEFFVTV